MNQHSLERHILQVGLFGFGLKLSNDQLLDCFQEARKFLAHGYGQECIPRVPNIVTPNVPYVYTFIRVDKPFAVMQGGLCISMHVPGAEMRMSPTLDHDELVLCMDSMAYMRRRNATNSRKELREFTDAAFAVALESLKDTEPWDNTKLQMFAGIATYGALNRNQSPNLDLGITWSAGEPVLRGKQNKTEARRVNRIGENICKTVATVMNEADETETRD